MLGMTDSRSQPHLTNRSAHIPQNHSKNTAICTIRSLGKRGSVPISALDVPQPLRYHVPISFVNKCR